MTQVKEKIRILKADSAREVEALFDTGASGSFLDERIAREVGIDYIYKEPKEVQLAIKGKKGEIIGYVVCRIEVNGYELPGGVAFDVVRDLFLDAVVGIDIIEKYRIRLDLEKGKVEFDQVPPGSLLI